MAVTTRMPLHRQMRLQMLDFIGKMKDQSSWHGCKMSPARMERAGLLDLSEITIAYNWIGRSAEIIGTGRIRINPEDGSVQLAFRLPSNRLDIKFFPPYNSECQRSMRTLSNLEEWSGFRYCHTDYTELVVDWIQSSEVRAVSELLGHLGLKYDCVKRWLHINEGPQYLVDVLEGQR